MGTLPDSFTGYSVSTGTMADKDLLNAFDDFVLTLRENGLFEAASKLTALVVEARAMLALISLKRLCQVIQDNSHVFLDLDRDLQDFVDESVELDVDDLRSKVSFIINEDIWDLMDSVAPDTCYFGADPGNGSDYGFWIAEDEDFGFDDSDKISA